MPKRNIVGIDSAKITGLEHDRQEICWTLGTHVSAVVACCMRESLDSHRTELDRAGCGELTRRVECQPVGRSLSISIADRNTLQCAVGFD